MQQEIAEGVDGFAAEVRIYDEATAVCRCAFGDDGARRGGDDIADVADDAADAARGGIGGVGADQLRAGVCCVTGDEDAVTRRGLG